MPVARGAGEECWSDSSCDSANRWGYRVSLWTVDWQGLSNQSLHGGRTGPFYVVSAGGWDAAGVEFVAGGCGRPAESGGAAACAGAGGAVGWAYGSYSTDDDEGP